MKKNKGLKRSGIKRKSPNHKKKNDKRKELAEKYGVKMNYWRYEGRKGIYWMLLSKYVRMRDFLKHGTCVSCEGEFEKWDDAQAGHYAPAGNCGFALLFDKDNVHAECPACNNPRFSPGKLIPYRSTLVKRYGEKYAKKLDERYKNQVITKEWSQKEYDQKIWELKAEVEELESKLENKE